MKKLIVDAHCDTLTAMEYQNRRLGEESGRGHLDLPRMKRAGVNVQFFAACVGPEYRHWATIRALDIIDLFYRELEANTESIEEIRTYADINRIVDNGKVAALLSIEGGDALSGELSVLRMFYRLGVRAITLTWNGRNQLADGVGERRSGGGLTRRGLEVVKEMNRLGMLVDVSHLADQGFWDVLKNTDKPLIASHSNCRALCGHPRNLSDRQIRELAEAGGVIGLNFYPKFICPDKPSLDRLLDHAVHMASVGGVGCLGLGSDFDGIEQVTPGLEDVTKIPSLAEGLGKRGFNDGEVAMILGGNWLRVLSRVI
ncbi:microsomal dipeptidase [Desulfocucumis palustris]|uniref:Microsomal dipeptidase n=1 Tax=Desulfocucumis palustris TaxID=1898651 RepID=A0A2L2XAM0_9FIRM|nr:dipeptidase [Desulfocucumis palustris]GBF32703.1 microsomal dipeptidase [Desulfocucumis palustris]